MPGNDKVLILGSRGSALALAQAGWAAERLRKANKGLEVRLEIVKTSGDTDQNTRLDAFPTLGVFVKEIQEALLKGRIDAAIHSLKDMPEDQPDALFIAAFPEREDARDVFVSAGKRFFELPRGARVGTGSPRRIMQLKALRPDLEFTPIRGNVDTRLDKAAKGEVAGVVLAAAGLRRLGKSSAVTQSFSFAECVPAVGQGVLALECRIGDERIRKFLAKLNDPLAATAARLERRFMRAVGGGCRVPMAGHAYPHGEGFRFLAAMGEAATGKMARVERSLDGEDAESEVDNIAAEILEECRARGIRTPRD
jgi:hydroxymethylbilane synthase